MNLLFWPILGTLTALTVGYVTWPLWQRHKKVAWIITFLLPLLGAGLYLWGGNPELIR